MSPGPTFRELTDSYLDLKWHLDPVEATGAGLPQFDQALGQFRLDAMQHHLAAFRSLASALEACEVESLQEEIDRTALLYDARVTIHGIERDKHHVRNPGFWASHPLEGLYLLLAREDRSYDHRAQAAASRLTQIPGFFEQARATLADCPGVFVRTGLDVTRAGVALVDDVAKALRPSDDEKFEDTCEAARDAMRAFADYLESELLENATADFACGEKSFNFRLQHEHALNTTAAELWQYGHSLVDEVEQEVVSLAAAVQPGADWHDVVDELRTDHPSAEGLVAAYAVEMDRARRFVEQENLVSVPAGPLEVVETPSFLSSLIPFAAYQPPGAFSEDKTGLFYVTPPGRDLSPDAAERMLRDHCTHDLPCTALHEGFPGHHLHFLHAQAQPRVVRSIVGTSVTVEGWALYCEEMMGAAGFYRSVPERLFQQVALLWRAVRIVADVGLHTKGMTFQEAVDLLVNRLHFDRPNAEAEVRRYCATPAYQIGYAVGRREIKSLHDDYRDAAGAEYSLRGFHEDLLTYGLLPVSLMRWGMGLN